MGREAKEMFGKTPTSKYMVVRPLRDGVIGEFEITEAMLDYFIRKAHEQNWVPIPVRTSWWASPPASQRWRARRLRRDNQRRRARKPS